MPGAPVCTVCTMDDLFPKLITLDVMQAVKTVLGPGEQWRLLCAQYWANWIEEAEIPNPLSTRDGKLLKPVLGSAHLTREDAVAHLTAALEPYAAESRDLICSAWARGAQPAPRYQHGPLDVSMAVVLTSC